MPSAASWIESLPAWPEEFGLQRMHTLLAALDNPQRRFRSIHVVGTNGKSTAARTIEELLAGEGLRIGAYLSPHVRSWSERIRVDAGEADFDAAIGRVRRAAARVGATQFEALTAAAFGAFADAEVDVGVVEAGLGGRLDATNVLAAELVVLTNVSLEHTEVLGDTREAIAAEKLAVLTPGATAVLGEPEWEGRARAGGAGTVLVGEDVARIAAETFLSRPIEREVDVALPGRFEWRDGELRDGAHNLAGVEHLVERLPDSDFVVVASILRDKDVDGMLAALATAGSTLVATQASNPRALAAQELAARARTYFGRVEAVADPVAARERARELAGPDGLVLVTGSLYLLHDLAGRMEDVRWSTSASG
jgi:dihydrofolate synthase/folylpolyglutamate synthase